MIPKDYVRDYIEGRIAPADFLIAFRTEPQIYEWLQTIVPKGKVYRMCHVQVNEYGQNAHVLAVSPYDVRDMINHLLGLCRGRTSCANYYIHMELAALWKEAFPGDEIAVSNAIRDRFFLELDLIPRYIGGAEVYEHGIIDDMINAISKQLSNAEQRAWCQARVNEIFHLHDGKHPYWREEPAWPIGKDHKPMRFLFQKCVDDVYKYYFVDQETNEVRQVIQTG